MEKNARPCTGASGRNGGFLWPGYDDLAGYEEDIGVEDGCRWVEFQHANIRAIAQVVSELAIDCDIDIDRGNVSLARDEAELGNLLRSYALVKNYIDEHPGTKMSLDNLELWDKSKCQEMLHSDRFIGALLMRESGTLWVAKFVYGLLKYCLDQSGVDLLTHSKVVRVENSTNVVLENGRVITARHAIVHASNAYTVEYLDFTRGKILPTRGQCSRSKPMETIFWPFGLSARDGREYYHQSPVDGRITLGGCCWRSFETEQPNRNDSEINELIREEHERYFALWHPGIATTTSQVVEIEQDWTGIMAFTVDKLPLIGPLPDEKQQYLLCGYNGKSFTLAHSAPVCRSVVGNGMPNAFLCAKAIARMIANEDPYKEGEQNQTVTFLSIFLPERFTKTVS